MMASILIKAILSGQESLAKDIIQCGYHEVNYNQTSKAVVTALFLCCSRGFLELAKLLLDKGVSVSSTDKNLATPLHGAVDNGYLNIVRLLINHGANVNAQNLRGDTPLHLAAYRGYREITRCLMDAGADCRLVNASSFIAENEAFIHGHRDVGEYLRSENKARYSSLTERNQQTFDSMIKLDYPLPVYKKESNNEQQPQCSGRKKQQHKVGLQTQIRKSDYNLSCEVYDNDTNNRHNLSFIALEPPESFCPEFSSLGQYTSSSQRQGAAKASSSSLHSANMRSSPQETPESCPYLKTVEVSALKPWMVSTSNSACSTSSLLTQRPSSTSPQPANVSFNGDNSRRPSTSSTCSFVSDISFGTGSDALSSISSGSDASGSFWDSRSEDVDFHDNKLVINCQENQEEDSLWLSLGVRNPPAYKYKTQLSTTSEATSSSSFSEFYDSTLFRLTVRKSESLSPPSIGGPSSQSMDATFTDKRKGCSDTDYIGVDYRSLLKRTSSENCSRCTPQNMLNVSHLLDKNNPANVTPSSLHLDSADTRVCPSFDRIPSNDLSCPYLMSTKSVHSLTSVNIPLN